MNQESGKSTTARARPRGVYRVALALLAGGLGLAIYLHFQAELPADYGEPAVRPPFPAAPEAAVEAFLDDKFGLFVHWGPASLTGREIGWSRGGHPGGSGTTVETLPAESYDQLYRKFNPTRFDARQWVAIARSAGMRYLVMVAKHHDGFCMFDTRTTDYNITRSPFGRDVLAELSAACREGGLKLGVYYSVTDWYHPDHQTPRHDRYLDDMTRQVTELCTGYGPLTVFWFDSADNFDDGRYFPDSQRIDRIIRRHQSDALINDRLSGGSDFSTWEQTLPQQSPGRPWEACMTLGQQWSYKPDDELKPPTEIIRTLVECAGRGGNLLLNVGPRPDGQIEAQQVEVLAEVGDWLERFGPSVYNTRMGPVEPQAWGVTTRQGRTVYVHILDPSGGPVRLPLSRERIVSVEALTGGRVDLVPIDEVIEIRLADVPPETVDTIVALELAVLNEDGS